MSLAIFLIANRSKVSRELVSWPQPSVTCVTHAKPFWLVQFGYTRMKIRDQGDKLLTKVLAIYTGKDLPDGKEVICMEA